jgi:hypothetical protein
MACAIYALVVGGLIGTAMFTLENMRKHANALLPTTEQIRYGNEFGGYRVMKRIWTAHDH